MKKNILTTAVNSLKAGGFALLAGFAVVSCTIQTGGYSETDGVYYDPSRDTLPEAKQDYRGNRVGEYYDYQDSAYAKSLQYGRYGSGKYKNWDDNATSSDWGTYAGTETNFNSWGNPYGFYSPYSFYRPYGFGSYFGLGLGFGSPWYGYGFGYSPFLYDGFYSPFYSGYYGYYSPYYYGYNPYGYGTYYNPYYYGYGLTAPRRSSGPDGFYNGSARTAAPNGFRTATPARNQNSVYQQRRTNSGDRTIYRQQNTDTYRNNSNGGFRSGGMDSGSMRSGGFNSGGSVRSSGGFRTGGR